MSAFDFLKWCQCFYCGEFANYVLHQMLAIALLYVILGNPPAEHLTSPPLSTQSYNCQLYAPESAPSTSMPNNNSAFNQTTAIHDQFAVMAKQGLGADTPLIPVVSMVGISLFSVETVSINFKN